MAGVTEKMMKENLLDYFPEMESGPNFTNIVNFGVFMSKGPESVEFKAGLASLEKGISNTVVEGINQRWDIKEGAQDVLRQYLRSKEMQDGFKTPDRSPVFMGFVTHGPFLSAIKDGMHWEDIGAGSGHGRYTHRLQWYIAARAGIFKGAPAGQAFKELGQHFSANPRAASDNAPASSTTQGTAVQSIGAFNETINGLSAWDVVCDRFATKKGAEKGSETDFRSPERMHAWLRSDNNTYSKTRAIVSGLSAHHPDRSLYMESGKGKSMADIYALRVYGKNADQMGAEYKQAFDLYLNDTQFGRVPGILTFDDGKKTASPMFKVPASSQKCYITTAVCQSLELGDDCNELQMLRHFRDSIMLSSPEGLEEVADYYRRAPLMVDRLSGRSDSSAIYSHLYESCIQPIVACLAAHDLAGAHLHYRELVAMSEKLAYS